MRRRIAVLISALLLVACADEPAPDAAEVAVDSGPDSMAVGGDSAAPGPFVPRDSIVFVFMVSEHEHIFFEPLFMYGGAIGAPTYEQGTPEADAFEAAYYATGTRYYATSGGVDVGQMDVDGPALAGCTGLPANASFVDKIPAAPMNGLAFAEPRAGNSVVVEPTAAEDSIARATALRLLREAGIPESKLPEVVWQPVVAVVLPNGSRTVLTTAELSGAFDDAEMPAMAFVMLELTPAGVKIHDSHSGDGRLIEGGRSEFLDAADLDGDGVPEIVLQNVFYESWDYSILRRVGDAWEQVFNGGGSGC